MLALAQLVWNGHSCPLPLTLPLILILILVGQYLVATK